MRCRGDDGNLVATRAGADPGPAASQGDFALFAVRGQPQDRVDGVGRRPRVGVKSGDPSSQPTTKKGRRQRRIDDVAVGHESFERVVVVAQQARVACQGRLDIAAARRQRCEHGVSQPAARVAAGGVVFVDDDVGDVERGEGVCQGLPRQRQERPHGDDAIHGGSDDGGGGATAAAAEPCQMQQDPFGDVAPVVREDDGADAMLARRIAQGRVARPAQRGLVAIMGRDGAHLREKPEAARAVNDRACLGGGGRTAAVVDTDDDERAVGAPAPTSDRLEQRA